MFPCVGYDISRDRILELEPKFAEIAQVTLSNSPEDLAGASHYLISVPTLLRPDRSVNLDYVVSAVRTVVKYA